MFSLQKEWLFQLYPKNDQCLKINPLSKYKIALQKYYTYSNKSQIQIL